MPRVSPPAVDEDNEFFWSGVAEGRLLIQRCSACGDLRHPPRPMCPQCLSLDWDTIEASGRGTVYSWVVSHHPSGDDSEPRVVVLVDLVEGTRLVANLEGTPWREVTNDMEVELYFAEVGGVRLPQFRVPRH